MGLPLRLLALSLLLALLAFFAAVAIAQIMLVLKKKQFEKVQAAQGL